MKNFYFFIVFLFLLGGCFKQIKPSDELKVSELNIEGNHHIPDETLKRLLPLKKGDVYVERFMMEGTKRIIDYYRSKGFFDMRIKRREGQFVKETNEIKMTYYIFEGLRSRIDSISINGNQLISDGVIERYLSIDKDEYYDEALIAAGEYNLLNEYAEMGYTNTEISVSKKLKKVNGSITKVSLFIDINEGNKVWVRDISYHGLEGVRLQVVEREMKIKEGDLYKPSKVYESQSRLYKTELFSDVNVSEEKVAKDSVKLIFNMKEEKPRFINFGFGYESPRKGILQFRWGHLNLFGNLQRLLIDMQLRAIPDFNGLSAISFKNREEDVRLTYRESYLLNSGFHLVASPALRREYTEDYKESDLSLDIVLERFISLNEQVSLLYDFRRATIQEAPSITNRLSLRYIYEGRDNVVNPQSGFRVVSQVEYAGGFLGGDNHFDRIKTEFAYYRKLSFDIRLALRTILALTRPRESADDISADARIEMGGFSTIRGFGDASIGEIDERGKRSGLDQVLLNVEFRIPIYKKLFATLFSDIGNIWMDYSDISLKNPKIGMGFGLGYVLPIGVVRLDYARDIKEVSTDYKGIVYVNFAHPF